MTKSLALMGHKLFNFTTFKTMRRVVFWPVVILGCLLSCVGLVMSFWGSPLDYQQKETVRIMYIHVPASWLALMIYAFMGFASIGGFVWRHSLGFIYARAAWPIGFVMCLMSLTTGSCWGKPMWGTWWVWDARLTSMFVLMIMYLGYGLFMQTAPQSQKSLEKGAVFLILGLVNLPIIKYSVDWWSTLHQPASLLREGGVAIDADMLVPLLVSFSGFLCLSMALGFLRVEIISFRHKRRRQDLLQARAFYAAAPHSRGQTT